MFVGLVVLEDLIALTDRTAQCIFDEWFLFLLSQVTKCRFYFFIIFGYQIAGLFLKSMILIKYEVQNQLQILDVNKCQLFGSS